MIQTSNGNYIYLVVPAKYECIYSNLINMVSNLSTDIIEDCTCSCSSKNKNIIDCWSMFQTAIIAYDENRENDADIIMINIVSKLDLKCDTKCFSDKYIYYGTSDEIPDLDYILKGDKSNQNKDSVVASFYKRYQYIAFPTGKMLHTVKNFNFRGDYLYDLDNNINLYNITKNVTINGELYIVYICELNYPLGSNVIISTKVGNWLENDIIYYGNSIDKPTISDLDSSYTFNPNDDNELLFKSDNITHFIMIPNTRGINYIRSVNGTIDWLYNKDLNIDLYSKEEVTIEGNNYTLIWFTSIDPINGDIKLVLK